MQFIRFSLIDLVWILFLISAISPALRQRRLERTRLALMRRLEQKRGSRLITMIHRQEAISFLGIPLTRYINIEDSEQVLRAIRMTPDDMPIDILLHTPGGLVLAADQIAHAITGHKAKVTVFVPHYAMSGGTLIALAADEIAMDQNAVLGPVDPQVGNWPAASILKAVSQKDKNKVDDETLILADIAEKAMRQVKNRVLEILQGTAGQKTAEELAERLTGGYFTHDYPLTCEELARMGWPVCGTLPPEIYELMEYYPQPAQRRPSVHYVPLPYGTPKGRGGGDED